MSTEYVRIAPFRGLGAQNVSDRARDPGTMRGGSNVMVKDGEWWVRNGEEAFFAEPIATAMFHWIVDIGDQMLLISEWQVISVSRLAALSVLHAADGSATCTWTNGSNEVERTGALTGTFTSDQLITPDASGSFTEAYRVIAYSSPTIELDRPYTGTTKSVTTRAWNPLMTNALPFPEPPDDLRTTYCIFEQLVTHSSSDMWTGSPALTAGRKYLIIASEKYGLLAYDLVSGAKITDFFRNTAIATPTAPAGGYYVTRYGDVLVIGRAGDPDGNAAERTIWFSRPGDLAVWHTGQQGNGATPNFLTMDGYERGFDNPITGVESFGDTLAVFRAFDVSICRRTGAAGVPLTTQRVASIGMSRPNLYANLGEQIAFVSRDGIYMLTPDGGVAPMSADIAGVLETIGLRELSPPCRRVFHWQKYNRLCVVVGLRNASIQAGGAATASLLVDVNHLSAKSEYASRQGVLICDLNTREWWLEDRPAIAGFGQQTQLATAASGASVDDMLVIRFDGSIHEISDKTDTTANGKDSAEVAYSAATYDGGTALPAARAAAAVVGANVETPWFDLGTGYWKQLQRMIVILRTYLANDLTSVGQTAHCATIDLYSDWDDDTVRETFDLTATHAQMSTGTEGQGLPEAKCFVLSPSTGGHVFKLRISNALSAASIAAGYKQAHFRLSEIGVFFTPDQSYSPLMGITET